MGKRSSFNAINIEKNAIIHLNQTIFSEERWISLPNIPVNPQQKMMR